MFKHLKAERSAVSRVHRWTRWARYGLYLTLVAVIWIFFSRFAFVSLVKGDDSVDGATGNRRIIVARLDATDRTIERGSALVFAMLDQKDEQIFRVSRVIALPGDRVTRAQGRYVVNGVLTEAPESRVKDLDGIVPEGSYILINDNLLSTRPDSRRLGPIKREWVIGFFLSEMPF